MFFGYVIARKNFKAYVVICNPYVAKVTAR